MNQTAMWVIGILVTLLVAGGTAFLTVLHSQMSGVLKKLDEIEVLLASLNEVKAAHEVRLEHLEDRVQLLRREVEQARRLAQRANSRIDRLGTYRRITLGDDDDDDKTPPSGVLG